MAIGKGTSHTSFGGWRARGGTVVGWGGWGRITWGEMPDIGDGGMEATNHIATYIPVLNPA